MKLQLIYLTICSLSQAAYISRMALINQQNSPNINGNRILRPTAFRPGVVMRPWNHPRLVQSSSHRVPYVIYRNQPQRYSMKHYTPTRMVTSPWKAATRQPTVTPSKAEYEFVRAATANVKQTSPHSDGGAIHTIPAPNLSLAEKPIVVLDENSGQKNNKPSVTSESSKPVFEATEKYPDPTVLHLAAKIEQPIGFSKPTSFSESDFQSLVRNNAAQLVGSELGLSALSLPQQSIQQPVIHHQAQVVTQQSIPQQFAQQNFVPQSIVPQQFTLHKFHTMPNAQEFMQAAPDGIVITPNALYQPDPEFLQKLQNQLLQRFPGIEFIPYAAGFQPSPVQQQQNQIQNRVVFPSLQYQQQIHIEHQQPQNIQTQTAFKPSPIQYLTHVDNQPAQSEMQIQTVTQPQQSQTVTQPTQSQTQTFSQTSATGQSQTQPPFFLLQNEQYTRQTPSSFAVAESQNQRYVVQRETQEGTVVSLAPQTAVTNVTENLVEVTSLSTPQNITLELVESAAKPEGTTVKYIIQTTTEGQKTSPVYYTSVTQTTHNIDQASPNYNNEQVAQASQTVTQTVQANQNNSQSNQNNAQSNQNDANTGNVQVAHSSGNVVTDSFYSAINNVRAEAALAQVEPQESTNTQDNVTTTTLLPTSTINSELKPYFTHKTDKEKQNQTGSDIKPVLGVPFAKAQNSVNVAYTLLRSDDKEAKVAKDGSVYAGQLVEASVSEDHDFNKQKANLLTRRAPIRLVAATEKKETNITTTTQRIPSRMTIVKARIPPKSKLTFDDKTGEPVLRIYASYVDSPAQKEAMISKLTNNKLVKEIAPRKQDNLESWKAANVKALAKPHGFEPSSNSVTQFGLKLRSRSDDYVPLFDDYED